MVGTVVIKRVFNNNVAMVTSDDGSELIVIGRGLCFGRHAGDIIDEASVEKTYALQEGTSQDSRTIDRLAHLLESIPTVNLVISEDIVQMLRREVVDDKHQRLIDNGAHKLERAGAQHGDHGADGLVGQNDAHDEQDAGNREIHHRLNDRLREHLQRRLEVYFLFCGHSDTPLSFPQIKTGVPWTRP